MVVVPLAVSKLPGIHFSQILLVSFCLLFFAFVLSYLLSQIIFFVFSEQEGFARRIC